MMRPQSFVHAHGANGFPAGMQIRQGGARPNGQGVRPGMPPRPVPGVTPGAAPNRPQQFAARPVQQQQFAVGKGNAPQKQPRPQQQRPVAQMQAQSLEAMETNFTRDVDSLYECLLDLNVPVAQLQPAWDNLLWTRDRILQMHYGRAGCAGGGAVAQAGGAVGAGADGKVDHKSTLVHCVQKANPKRTGQKGDFQYSVSEYDGGYIAELSSEFLQNAYTGEYAAKSKREAEHEVARVALMHEFPEHGTQNGPPAAKGVKRGREEPAAAPQETASPRQTLSAYAQLLIEGTMIKGDITYQAEEQADGQFVCAVFIPKYAEEGWQGEPAATKKLSEDNAAAAAVDSLGPIVAPLEEARQAEKKRKRQEQLKKFLEKQDQKKADAAATADAAGGA